MTGSEESSAAIPQEIDGKTLVEKLVVRIPFNIPGRCPNTGRKYSQMPEYDPDRPIAPNCSECGTQLRPVGVMAEFGWEHQ